jgi:hypothetical protein
VAFKFTASVPVVLRPADFVALMMKLSGVSVRVEPRKMTNQFVPQPPLRDPTQDQLVQRMLQGAIPDRVNTDPMVEVKLIK